jgi:hypothetical protein
MDTRQDKIKQIEKMSDQQLEVLFEEEFDVQPDIVSETNLSTMELWDNSITVHWPDGRYIIYDLVKRTQGFDEYYKDKE